MLALVPFNWQVHDTHFVVAHMHYVLVGGMLFPLVAGLYYWLPHVSGRMPSDALGRWGFWLFFGGFNLTFLLMHLTGLLGMPRRIYTYEAGLGWGWLNLVSSIGGFIMAIGVAVVIVDIALHFRFGKRARQNPWGADTLEWAIPMPVNTYNFSSLPDIDTRHPMWHNPSLVESIAAGEHGLANVQALRRDIYGSDATTGKVQEVVHLPTNSWLPLMTASALAMLCISLLVKAYLVAIVFTVLALGLTLRWGWENGAHPRAAPVDDNEPGAPPLHSRTCSGPGLWGMVVSLMADGTFYVSLLFGWFYLWTAAPQWAVPDQGSVQLLPTIFSGLLLTLAVVVYCVVARGLRKGHVARLGFKMWLVTVLGWPTGCCLQTS